MPIEILMPALSPTMQEGKIVSWLKKEGDDVSTSDVIVEIETDKAIMELDSPGKGKVGKIFETAGKVIPVGSLIGLILKPNEDNSVLENYVQKPDSKNLEKRIDDNKSSCSEEIKETKSNLIDESTNQDRIKISPLAKKIAEINNVDFSIILGSGPNNRIIKSDIENILKSQINEDSSINFNEKIIKRMPSNKKIELTSMRKAIASKLSTSKKEIPHFYIGFEVNMDNLLNFRSQINQLAPIENEKPKYKISVNDLIIKASALALKKFNKINASWQENIIIEYSNIDISVAVSIENGLITPIVENVDQKNIFNISNEVKTLAKKAKEGKLQPKEYQGGGFTISNLGGFDFITEFTAIVNHPQAAILAVSSTIKKPVIKNDKYEISHLCNMKLSADHRIVDGVYAAEFCGYLKNLLENPISLIINI